MTRHKTLEGMLSLPTILLILVLSSLQQHHSVIAGTSTPALSRLLKDEKLVIRGIGLLQGNRRLLLVYQEAAAASLVHSIIIELEESAASEKAQEKGQLAITVPAKAEIHSAPSSSSSASALGGFILQSGTTFGWAQFARSNDGNVTLDWYRHASAGGGVAKVICTYASSWMKALVTEMALFSRSEPAVFAYLSSNEILPGLYSVTEGAAGEGPIIRQIK